MQKQINGAISSAINDIVLLEIQNMIGSLPLDQNVTGTGTSLIDQGLGNIWKEPSTKCTKKDSRSARDLRENLNFIPYILLFVIGHEIASWLNSLDDLIFRNVGKWFGNCLQKAKSENFVIFRRIWFFL